MLNARLKIVSVNAETIISSLKPEAGRELPRTQVRVFGQTPDAIVEIDAADTSAMRAALNSYLECIRITEDIERITR